jgi:hypothetical protein
MKEKFDIDSLDNLIFFKGTKEGTWKRRRGRRM